MREIKVETYSKMIHILSIVGVCLFVCLLATLEYIMHQISPIWSMLSIAVNTYLLVACFTHQRHIRGNMHRYWMRYLDLLDKLLCFCLYYAGYTRVLHHDEVSVFVYAMSEFEEGHPLRQRWAEKLSHRDSKRLWWSDLAEFYRDLSKVR